MRGSYLFTSESVSEGHPDKVCDRISDEMVDLFFREGPKAGIDPWAIRVACETLATTNRVVIAGETRGPQDRSPTSISKTWSATRSRTSATSRTVSTGRPPTSKSCCTRSRPTSRRASTPAAGNKDEGAGDQGIMFGYACRRDAGADAGADLLRPQDPAADLAEARHAGDEKPCSGPDAKSQVTVQYENGKPVGATQIVRVAPASRSRT